MNPLYNALFGSKQGQIQRPQQQTAVAPQMDMNALMGQLQANPAEALRSAGYTVPQEMTGDPQSTVMHLLRTGQIGGPMMQRIAPMLQRMGVR